MARLRKAITQDILGAIPDIKTLIQKNQKDARVETILKSYAGVYELQKECRLKQ